MKAKEKLLIVDGHNLLFQMFFGMPNRIINKDGKAIQGVIGFVGALNKIIKQVQPTHVVVLFDGEYENSRTELLPEYKGNREDYSLVEEEENPFSQLPDVYRALDYMGIKYCETEDVEADDVIASYVLTYGKELLDIVISSWDSDFFQLISENVKILRYRGKCTTICDVAYLKEKFDIAPEVYADFKSIVGDNADNIKGAKGIGPKTASALLKQFGSLGEILKRTAEIEKKKVRESIEEDKDRLQINYEIIKLNDKAKLPFDLEELQYNKPEQKTNEVMQGIGLM
ncbi:MAG: flap endonuclease [Lachnospiraceae bacterium]|nr:flap endonuclease [Lachnospiraceae bacterium]